MKQRCYLAEQINGAWKVREVAPGTQPNESQIIVAENKIKNHTSNTALHEALNKAANRSWCGCPEDRKIVCSN